MKHVRKFTKTSLNRESKELAHAGHILKGYVNYLRRKTLLEFQLEEKIKQSNKKIYESSKNLIINKKKKKKKKKYKKIKL